MIAKSNEQRLINSVFRTKPYSLLPSKMKKQILVRFFFFFDVLNLNTQLFGSWLPARVDLLAENEAS